MVSSENLVFNSDPRGKREVECRENERKREVKREEIERDMKRKRKLVMSEM